MAYVLAEKYYASEGFESAEEFIESMGGVDAFMGEALSSQWIEVFNFDDEVLKESFRLKKERVVADRYYVQIREPIDNLDLVVEEVLKLDKDVTIFEYKYVDETRNEPVYPTLTPEQQQRLGEKFPTLIV